MPEFTPVCKVSDMPDPDKMVVEIEDRLVALFHVAGQFYAIDDLCTHDGGPLAEGELQGYTIICPRHGARFDIRTGAVLCMPATRDTIVHEVKVEEGQVCVRVNEK